ncbi:serine hydrolase domain-containing protein [Gracilibacillus alcaliphilus]|uniref:serine hydrolase domain-containing protein n=1 Tax=Gracilibacillus alcaliphilus TaxID=1401441 RepID=UPI00195E21EA|nr:serine hydrolase domain-containing protein [Gracilibacillus alcaliphilus]MBM7675891.1 CubicO group peptidase (beta-lactamase class C family) [Gracilibacillus alcaliphilus]
MKQRVMLGCLLVLLICVYFPNVVSAEEKRTPSGISLTELEDVVDGYVNNYIGETVAGAGIVVIKDSEIVLSKGYGYADIEEQIPIDTSVSILEWGSITKLFVWVSVMQLVEEGKLDLYEDIQTYLPEDFLTSLTFDEPITMLHLMHHNAGYEENIYDLLYDSPKHLTSLEEALKITEPDQVYRPGEVVAYSNYSTALAAYIVEQVTGRSFDDYVSEHIFAELGIEHSTIHLPAEDREEIFRHKTKGYSLSGIGEFKESPPFYISMYPSGGMNGTAEDLARFAMALMPVSSGNTSLFQDHQTLTELLSPSYAVQEGVPGIAHGFWEYDGAYRGLTHSGNTVAFSSNVQIVPEENFAVIILTNQANEVDLLFGLTDELVGDGEQTIQANLPTSDTVEGSYLSARRVHSGFMNLYSYLMPLQIRSISEHEIEANIAGFTANYVQTSPYVYKMINGDHVFIPNKVMYFHVKNGKVEQISTSYSDYTAMDKPQAFLIISLGVFIWCAVYFLISPLLLMLRIFWRWRKRQRSTSLTKWNWLLNLSGTVMILNILVLAVRMLTNAMRAYSELLVHFILNYAFTAISLISLVMVIVCWRKTQVSNIRKTGYLLSSISSMLFIAWLIIWQLYA